MSTDSTLDCHLCAALDIVAMEAIAGGKFQVLQPTPAWRKTITREIVRTNHCQLERIFPFLEDFLQANPPHDDLSPQDTRLSGIWQESSPEDGSPWQLEASTFQVQGRRYVCIERLRTASEDRHTLLQRGRESQLRHETSAAQHQQLEIELRRAKENAETSRDTKSRFLANVSHELRTPLHGILGMTLLALKSSHDDRQAECLQAVHRSAQSLLEIVNDLLDLSKIEAGKLELQHEPFSLRALLSEIVVLLQPPAREKNLELTCDVDATLPDEVVGDSLRLRQLLNNLVGNAIKFTEQGYVRIAAQPSQDAEHDGFVAMNFTVCDSGIGMSEMQQRRIFLPFEQGDGSTTREYGGTGLGLSICQHLVRMMQGRMWLQSTPGGGSRFGFSAIFRRAVPRVEPAADDSAVPVARSDAHLRPLRILLAEDNCINQRLVQLILAETGHELDIVDHGEAVLERLREAHYDVCLMDCQMPGIDGYEATRQIRAMEPPRCRVIIIALTAGAMPSDRDRCLEAGMDDYLAKPFQPSELLLLLEKLGSICR
ncbi:MAG: ATP-binding protein [Planctomycetota bacterium]|nr:ATP-binding protein [Planctomycetota bacterium]